MYSYEESKKDLEKLIDFVGDIAESDDLSDVELYTAKLALKHLEDSYVLLDAAHACARLDNLEAKMSED